MIALSESSTITFSVAGVLIVLGLFVLLRILFRKEPSPPSWRRFRAGIFVERDPTDETDDTPPD